MNLRKIGALILVVCSTSQSFGSLLQDPETTRMKGLAGAGVAALLINEAPIFNPASIAFFTKSTILYEQGKIVLEDEAKLRESDHKEGYNETFVITDTSSTLRGGLAYHYQNIEEGKRKQFLLSLANNVGKKTGIGFTIRHNEEESLTTDRTYTQLTYGLTYIHKKNLSFGLNIIDITQVVPEYFSYRIGFQYTFNRSINIIGDIGSGDVQNYNEEIFNILAVQLQAFKSLFLRAGKYHDKRRNRQGTSFGFAWTGPRLSLDYAVKSAEIISEEADTLFTDDKTLETSLGLTVIF